MAKTLVWIPDATFQKAPSLVVSVRPLGAGEFNIIISHPNTKQVLHEQIVQAEDLGQALKIGTHIRQERLRGVLTTFEESKHHPRPKRGKFALKTKGKK